MHDGTDAPSRPKTHYEILKVEPGVAADDLRVAYRILSRRYHPDRHPKHADAAARIMASVNVAYDVLSDPERRAAYDREIGIRQPPRRAPRRVRMHRGRPVPAVRAGVPEAAPDGSGRRRAVAVRRLMAGSLFCCMAALLVIGWVVLAPGPDGDGPQPLRLFDALLARSSQAASDGRGAQPADVPVRPPVPIDLDGVHIRPLESPAGLPWPSASGELAGFARLFATGQERLVLDNRLGPSDVFAKVYRVDGIGLVAARHAFVRARERLLLDDFPPGDYEVHYQSLDTGQTLRSVPPLSLGGGPEAPAVVDFRLDDMQGRSGRAVPITPEVFRFPALTLKASPELATGRPPAPR